MALFFVERIKEQFGKDKEAVALYEQMTVKRYHSYMPMHSEVITRKKGHCLNSTFLNSYTN